MIARDSSLPSSGALSACFFVLPWSLSWSVYSLGISWSLLVLPWFIVTLSSVRYLRVFCVSFTLSPSLTMVALRCGEG